MSITKILVLESEDLLRQQLLEQLQPRGYDVTTVATLAAVTEPLARQDFDLVLTDQTLTDGTASDLLARLQDRLGRLAVVVITPFGSVEPAVECLRQGALSLLLKPFSQAQLEVLIEKAAEHLRLRRLNQLLSQEPDADGGWELLGESAPMNQLRQILRQVARTDATVLITGESGTGKERVARALYLQSARAQAPLLTLNCAGLPDHQIAAELFGQEKGATPGAAGRRYGRFELAHRGTLLLDEISEIPLSAQSKLLRLLQDRVVQRLGGHRPLPVDVRVLATTSRNLEDKVHRQEFREDLYLRLNMVPIALPPLRERKSDLPMLVEHFRQRFARKHGSPALAVSPACLAALETHAWPGNVRELKNVIERAVMACRVGNILEPAHLGSLVGGAHPVAPAAPAPAAAREADDLSEIEKQHILKVLEKCRGNRTHAAQRLGISIRTLRNKLKAYRANQETGDAESPPAAGAPE